MLSKRLLVTITLIFLLMVLQAPYLNIVKASPTIIRVPQDKPTIQSAIDSAKSGDIILISSGTYNERINITYKSGISIIGENPNTTIIDGMNENATVVRVAVCTHITIANLTIKGAGSQPEVKPSGILLFNSTNTVIANVTITNNLYAGILLQHSSHNLIENNLVSNNSYGILISSESPYNAIIHNNFINNDESCIIYSSNNDVIYNYWDDYQGEDGDGDGLGDTCYLGSFVTDECPLIEMWTLAKLTKEFNVETHIITIRSSAAISAFNYNQPLKEISFNINGPSKPSSLTFFCEVYVPKTLLNASAQERWRVLLNGTEVPIDVSMTEDYTLINFTGHFSKLEVQIKLAIIADFKVYVPIIAFMILMIAAVIIFVKLRIKKTCKIFT